MRETDAGNDTGSNEYETSPPPLGCPAEKSERTDGEKKRGRARGENAALCAPSRLPGTTYLQSFIITSAARFLTRSIIRRKYNTMRGGGWYGWYQGYTTRVW